MSYIRHWLPRILALAFALFLAVFALDVFGETSTIAELLLALFIHLIPSFLLLAAALVAWRMRVVGGILFIVLGILSIVFFNTYRELTQFLLISAPALVIGILFLWDAMPPTRATDEATA